MEPTLRVALLLFVGAIRTVGGSSSWCENLDEGYKMEWEDDFRATTLDWSKWSVVCSNETQQGCESLPFGTHVPSNGAECRSALCVPENVILDGEYLTLLSKRVSPNSESWTTGAVKTVNKASWSTDNGTFRVCISASLPGFSSEEGKAQGIWPAHWMMPEDKSCDPDEGEMDIMEMINGEGISYSTYHWQDNWPNVTCAYPKGHQHIYGSKKLKKNWSQEFHEFAVERAATHIAFAVDGEVIMNSTATGQNVLLWPKPFYLILNTAVGGPWPGEPNEETISPVEHKIDYVKVSRKQLG
eukprot:jgi/Bigna1/86262/estExt_fgenesh1_pg.C_90141